MDETIALAEERAHERGHQGMSYQCYHHVPGFGRTFKPPAEPFLDLLYGFHERPGYPPTSLLNPYARV